MLDNGSTADLPMQFLQLAVPHGNGHAVQIPSGRIDVRRVRVLQFNGILHGQQEAGTHALFHQTQEEAAPTVAYWDDYAQLFYYWDEDAQEYLYLDDALQGSVYWDEESQQYLVWTYQGW